MIPAWVEPYIGKPFVDRGRDMSGFDCYGLVYHVFRYVFGVQIPSFTLRYDTTNDRVAVARLFFAESISARWRRVTLADAQPPDVLAISLAGARHVGILVAPDRFLHVMTGRQTCVERIRPQWEPRIDGVYRHAEVAVVV